MPTTIEQLSSRLKRCTDERSVISDVFLNLYQNSQAELDPIDSVMLLEVSYESLLEWISSQREKVAPAEGSNYDLVLDRAQIFVEKWHAFSMTIENFAHDAYLGSQLAYGFCGMLLEVCSCQSFVFVSFCWNEC